MGRLIDGQAFFFEYFPTKVGGQVGRKKRTMKQWEGRVVGEVIVKG